MAKTNLFTNNISILFHNFLANNDIFVFGSDYDSSIVAKDSMRAKLEILEKTIFGVRVQPSDISYMLTNTIWEPGIVYTMYDDQADLSNSNFYVIVEPEEITGDYYIFKCIFNNNGGISTDKPLYDININSTGGESNLSDGYIWKYMCTVPYDIVLKFKTQGYFPIVEDSSTSNTAVDGIHTILVENSNTNYGYEKIEGVLDSVPDDDTGRVALIISENSTFNESANIYSGKVLYVTKYDNGDIIGSKQYVIANSGKIGLMNYVDILDYSSSDFSGAGIEKNDSFVILPRVLITGNGTGAEGIVEFDSTNTRLNSIQMISRGSGYTSATAEIVDPVYINLNSGDVRAILRPIISPVGGHGANLVEEFGVHAVGVSGVIDSNSTSIPDSNFYSKIALVSNPQFSTSVPTTFDNRLELAVSSNTGAVVGLEITQTNGAKGIIHEVSGNTIFVANYVQPDDSIFTTSLPLSLGSIDININTITESIYEQRTGEIFYTTEFIPIERTAEKRELIKILIDF